MRSLACVLVLTFAAVLSARAKAPLFAFPDGVLRVTAEGVPAPTRIRYLFDSGAFGALVNGIGLPAGPFLQRVRRE